MWQCKITDSKPYIDEVPEIPTKDGDLSLPSLITSGYIELTVASL
jgi:hypothetical protein